LKEIIKNTTFADRLLFLSIIVFSISGIFIAKQAMPSGTDVIIEIDGKPEYKFPLNINRTFQVSGLDGKMVIEIREKKVRVAESDCPKKYCVKQGWVSKGVIVCLPNKILVIVGGYRKNLKKDIDAITG
jgi:hypothetical protein